MSSTRPALAPEVGQGEEATSSSKTTNQPTLEPVACPPPTNAPADDKVILLPMPRIYVYHVHVLFQSCSPPNLPTLLTRRISLRWRRLRKYSISMRRITMSFRRGWRGHTSSKLQQPLMIWIRRSAFGIHHLPILRSPAPIARRKICPSSRR